MIRNLKSYDWEVDEAYERIVKAYQWRLENNLTFISEE